ncbi:MAG: Ppx/GppA family phosphatase [Acidobacteria bacterium]|nr:Ppx/GppA family phosphatase [Acidobacteriota bacterium]
MPKFAAIDIGSNSVRMLAAEVSGDGPLVPLASDRQVTRLGESVFRQGRFSEEAMDTVCASLRRMAAAYRKFDVAGVRAVATAATRDASNQVEFLTRASEALGREVEVISGQEEARLIHLGVLSRWQKRSGKTLLVDVGGGSCEVMLSSDGRLQSAWSKPLGAVRLTEVFLKQAADPPGKQDLHNLEQFIDGHLEEPLEGIGRGAFDHMVATSATAAAIVCGVNRVPRARREEADGMRASRTQVRRFYQPVAARKLAERKKVTGIGPRRAEIIVAGAAVFSRVLDLFEHPSMHYLAVGVREGIIQDLASRGVGRENYALSREQRAVVEKLAKRFGVNLKRARFVAALEHQLFDCLSSAHGLPAAWSRLLEAAAYLMDAGHYISDTGHHKHASYVVQNADLAGFTEVERRIVAMLCRFHRKSMPAARHTDFQALDAETKRSLVRAIPILRLADALDHNREQHVESLECSLAGGVLSLTIRSGADTGLEQWAAQRVGDLFTQHYGIQLVVAGKKSR